MKKILLITLLLFQIGVYAQNDSKLNIGIEYSIDKLSIDNGKNNDYLITQGNINGYGIKFDRNNYSLGLTTKYLINEKLSLSSGLLYSNKDFIGTYNCATCDFIGTFPGYSPEKIEQRFLVIPISINYSFLSGKLKPVINGGFNNNLEIKNDLKEQSKSYFLEAFIGVSMNYRFSEKWNAGIGYNYQTALTDLYKTDDFNLRTTSFNLQIEYRIK